MLRILAQTEQLDDLLETLRDLTRFGLGAPQPFRSQPTDVRALCIDVIQELANGKGVRFDFECRGDCHGFWDADLLTRAARLVIEECQVAKPPERGSPRRTATRTTPSARRRWRQRRARWCCTRGA